MYLAELMKIHRSGVQMLHAYERAWPEVGPCVAFLMPAFYDALSFVHLEKDRYLIAEAT